MKRQKTNIGKLFTKDELMEKSEEKTKQLRITNRRPLVSPRKPQR
jgi:hypothetical protein